MDVYGTEQWERSDLENNNSLFLVFLWDFLAVKKHLRPSAVSKTIIQNPSDSKQTVCIPQNISGRHCFGFFSLWYKYDLTHNICAPKTISDDSEDPKAINTSSGCSPSAAARGEQPTMSSDTSALED